MRTTCLKLLELALVALALLDEVEGAKAVTDSELVVVMGETDKVGGDVRVGNDGNDEQSSDLLR